MMLREEIKKETEIEKLQNKNIDGVLTSELASGKVDALSERKQLNSRANLLHEGVFELHQLCSRRLKVE